MNLQIYAYNKRLHKRKNAIYAEEKDVSWEK